MVVPWSTAGSATLELAGGDFDGDCRPDVALQLPGSGNPGLTVKLRLPDGGFAAGVVMNRTSGEFAVADVDGDGRADLVDGTGNTLLLRPGSTPNVMASTYEDFSLSARVAGRPVFGDVDGDGALDLVLPTASGIAVVRRVASGAVVSSAPVAGNVAVRALALLDADADGSLDLALATATGLQLLLGDGQGGFTASSAGPATQGAVESVVAAELDGDGRPDLALIDGLGLGTFHAESRGGFALRVGRPLLPASQRQLAAGDVDGDGDLDLLVAQSPLTSTTGRLHAFLNDGAGHLAEPVGTFFRGTTTRFELADMDRDGRADALISGFSTASALQSYGGGRFAGSPGWAAGLPGEVRLIDADGDGQRDLLGLAVQGDGGSAQLTLLAAVDGGFGTSRSWAVGADVSALHAFGRGLAFSLRSGELVPLALPDDGGAPLRGTVFPPLASQISGEGDVDGDGLIDVWCDGYGASLTLRFAQGDGGIEDVPLEGDGGLQGRAQLADVDGDGRADLVAPVSGETLVLLQTSGRTFTDRRWPSLPIGPRGVADLDGDGRDELLGTQFVGSNSEVASVTFADDGGFAARSLFSGSTQSLAVAPAAPGGRVGLLAGSPGTGGLRGSVALYGDVDGGRLQLLRSSQTDPKLASVAFVGAEPAVLTDDHLELPFADACSAP